MRVTIEAGEHLPPSGTGSDEVQTLVFDQVVRYGNEPEGLLQIAMLETVMLRLRYRVLRAAIARLEKKRCRKRTASQRVDWNLWVGSWRDVDLFRACSIPNVRDSTDLELIGYYEILARRHGQFRFPLPTHHERLHQQYGDALHSVESQILRCELLFWFFWMAVIFLVSAAVGGLIYFIFCLIG